MVKHSLETIPSLYLKAATKWGEDAPAFFKRKPKFVPNNPKQIEFKNIFGMDVEQQVELVDWAAISWGNMVKQIRTIAKSLVELGIGKGDKVGIWASSSPVSV